MALRAAMLKYASSSTGSPLISLHRWAHSISQTPALDSAVTHSMDLSLPLILPEHENNSCVEEACPNWSAFSSSLEVMAVPKKKVSPHKRGIRNGPKALKPVQVIIRCKVCGRVRLPHFFCCSGIKPNTGEHNG